MSQTTKIYNEIPSIDNNIPLYSSSSINNNRNSNNHGIITGVGAFRALLLEQDSVIHNKSNNKNKVDSNESTENDSYQPSHRNLIRNKGM
jgi:hypothetical protein